MSWDVIILNLPPEIHSPADIRDDVLLDLGSKAEFLARLDGLFLSLAWRNPKWGSLAEPGFSIEFNIGEDDPVRSLMLHVRGSDGALGVIKHLCESTGWRALDFGEGKFIDLSTQPAGLGRWRDYRDRVLSETITVSSSFVVASNPPDLVVDALDVQKRAKKWWQFWRGDTGHR